MIINYLPKDQTDAPLSRNLNGPELRKAGYSPVGERDAEMKFVYDDGGREAAGFKGSAGD